MMREKKKVGVYRGEGRRAPALHAHTHCLRS